MQQLPVTTVEVMLKWCMTKMETTWNNSSKTKYLTGRTPPISRVTATKCCPITWSKMNRKSWVRASAWNRWVISPSMVSSRSINNICRIKTLTPPSLQPYLGRPTTRTTWCLATPKTVNRLCSSRCRCKCSKNSLKLAIARPDKAEVVPEVKTQEAVAAKHV